MGNENALRISESETGSLAQGVSALSRIRGSEKLLGFEVREVMNVGPNDEEYLGLYVIESEEEVEFAPLVYTGQYGEYFVIVKLPVLFYIDRYEYVEAFECMIGVDGKIYVTFDEIDKHL